MKKRYEDGIVPQMNQDIRADFARQIRAIRQSQHLTQQVLADRVGTKKSNISRMESCLSSRYSIMGCSGILQLRLHLHARNRRHYILLPEAAW